MLNSRYPIALYWGPELALIYNDAWSPIPGGKHPWALGRPAREVWPEIWETIGPLFDKVMTSAEGVWQEDELLPMNRRGYLEECYFNFTFSPIRGEGGTIDGIFNAVVETTDRVLSEWRTGWASVLIRRSALRASAGGLPASSATMQPTCRLRSFISAIATRRVSPLARRSKPVRRPRRPKLISVAAHGDSGRWPMLLLRRTLWSFALPMSWH
jgi:hypothetical protein